MSDSKLSALPLITTPTLADLLYIVQGGVSDAITVGNLIQRAPALTLVNALTAPSLTLSTTPLGPASGGTGVANNAASTLTISGAFATTLTVTGVTGITLPTSGTLLSTTSTSATPQFARLGLGAAADAAIPLLISGGTVTVSTPVISVTQTWNAGAVTFTGALLNVTSTASAAASLLMDLQVASVSQWNVTKAGKVTQLGVLVLPSGAANAPSLAIGATSQGFYSRTTKVISVGLDGIATPLAEFNQASAGFVLCASWPIAWTSSSQDASGGTQDTFIYRDAAATLALRNSTTAQRFRVYNTFTTLTTAGEWMSIDWQASANVCQILTFAGSTTGTTRPLTVGAGTSVGTDIAGATTTIQGGISTGAGLGGSILFTLTNKAGTGTAANTIGTVLTLAPPNSGTTALVNGITITGAITTVSPSIAATGSDTNINILLTPKGTGQVVTGIGSTTAPSYSFVGGLTSGICFPGTTYIALVISSTIITSTRNTGLVINNNLTLGFDSTTSNGDLFLARDAAQTLAQRNGANAQVARTYFTYTDASNYSRLALNTASATMEFAAESAGTGAANIGLTLTPKGTGNVKLTTGSVQFISTGGAPITGNAVLVGGAVTVSTTAVTANSKILLTRKTSGGTIGTSITYTISAGTSFTITSDNVLDTSTFTWLIVEGF